MSGKLWKINRKESNILISRIAPFAHSLTR